jgi:hypothetical protein
MFKYGSIHGDWNLNDIMFKDFQDLGVWLEPGFISLAIGPVIFHCFVEIIS